MIKLSKHYDTLTAAERLKLSIEAAARQDDAEVRNLSETCPRFTYQPQRDLAYTGKYLDLQSIVLLHAGFFWQQRGAMMAASMLNLFMPSKDNKARYQQRRAELMAMIEAWARFCESAGFDPETLLKAFGLILEPKFEDLPMSDTEPDQAMIDTLYQAHLRHWQS
jgi:hypothetical protein